MQRRSFLKKASVGAVAGREGRLAGFLDASFRGEVWRLGGERGNRYHGIQGP